MFEAKQPLFAQSFLFAQVRPDSAVLGKLVGNLHRPAFPLVPTDATCTYIGIIGNDSMQVACQCNPDEKIRCTI